MDGVVLLHGMRACESALTVRVFVLVEACVVVGSITAKFFEGQNNARFFFGYFCSYSLGTLVQYYCFFLFFWRHIALNGSEERYGGRSVENGK